VYFFVCSKVFTNLYDFYLCFCFVLFGFPQQVAAAAPVVPVSKPAVPSAPPKAVAGRKRKGGEAGWDAI